MAHTVVFRQVVQDSDEFGSDEVQSVSRVFFDLKEGEELRPLFVDVREPVGGTHQEDEIEVLPLKEDVSFDQNAFEEAVKAYYQSLVNSASYGKHLAKGKGFRSQGTTLAKQWVAKIKGSIPIWLGPIQRRLTAR